MLPPPGFAIGLAKGGRGADELPGGAGGQLRAKMPLLATTQAVITSHLP
jgi:hypothetical protein